MIDESRMSSLLTEDLYESRVRIESLITRPTPVIWSNIRANENKREIDCYGENGFSSKPSLISLEECKQVMKETSDIDNGKILESDTLATRSIFGVHNHSQSVLAIAKRFKNYASSILGDGVYLFQSRINYKLPFLGKGFFWHSDFETWHMQDGMPLPRCFTLAISLTDTDPCSGPLLVIPGSHKWYVRCTGKVPDNFEDSLRKQEDYGGTPSIQALQKLTENKQVVPFLGKSGDGFVFDCNVMHGSQDNYSHKPRTVLFLVYNSIENKLVAPYGGKDPRAKFCAERDYKNLD